MKKAYVLIQWDMMDDSETILAVYLSKDSAERAKEKYESDEKKYKRTLFSYFISLTDLIEE